MAFLVVTSPLSVFGDELGSLSLMPRAAVISGVLVAFMVNVVMPVLSAAVAHWMGRPPQTRPDAGRPRTTSGEEGRA